MRTTDAQVRKLMDEMSKHGKQGLAALKAGMDRKTARKYLRLGKLPSELAVPRTWRTRTDPFADDWEMIKQMLRDAPELEAQALFDYLCRKYPERYAEGQVRTLQRRVKQWRATEGPSKVVFFPQAHRPGEAMQTDFTWATELAITIQGEAFAHMLCHPVLPYSNWEWVTVCRSEAFVSLKRGIQQAVFRLGRVPEYSQTDHTTAATHDVGGRRRDFNEEYKSFVEHLGMKPRTIGVGAKEQNGDVEALNGALKRRLEQHLLLRGSRDFDDVDGYERWAQEVAGLANKQRTKRLAEEMAVMKPLMVQRLPEYREERKRVTSWSTIRVDRNAYSVPSRLRDEWVTVRKYDSRLEVYYGGEKQMVVERLPGREGHRINYRHIIWSLVQKPGAFARYRYREDLFPTMVFRRTYDALKEKRSAWEADVEYLRILHLAASTMESEVESACEQLLAENHAPTIETVKTIVGSEKPTVPELQEPVVDLTVYDGLLGDDEQEEVG